MFDPAKFRERLGLEDDISDDEVMEAFAYAKFADDEDTPTTEATPVAASAPADMVAKSAGATVILASSKYEELVETNKRMAAFMEKTERNERDQVIAQAVKDGKFTPAQAPQFKALFDVDPKGTRALIDSLHRNSALSVAASGYSTETGEWEEDELDREIARLSPSRKGA